MKKRIGFALFALLVVVFVGCKKEESKYMVQVSATDGGTIDGQNGEYKEGETVVFTAKPNEGCYFIKWSDGNSENPRTIVVGSEDISLIALFFTPIVDLGLESGTLWAACNLGADNPWDYGDYYAWGETETKDDYSWETYKHSKWNRLTKYCSKTGYGDNGYTDTLTTLLPEDDVVTVVLGSDYSMPTIADWEELYNQCYWVWTTNYNEQNVIGYIVYKAKHYWHKGEFVHSGNTPDASYSLYDTHIFLPAAGFRSHTTSDGAGTHGNYWSASLHDDYQCDAYYFFFSGSSDFAPSHYSNPSCIRYYGQSVRPVRRTN